MAHLGSFVKKGRARPARALVSNENGRQRRPFTGMAQAYQAATTAPLYLVSMNCFTAGLW